MSLIPHNVCKLKDGRELNFNTRCNYMEAHEGMIWFYAVNPDDRQKNILLEAINVSEISRIIHEFPEDLYEELMKPAPKIVVPEKKIITP